MGRTGGLTALQIGLKQQRSSYISLQNKLIRFNLFFSGVVKSDTKLAEFTQSFLGYRAKRSLGEA